MCGTFGLHMNILYVEWRDCVSLDLVSQKETLAYIRQGDTVVIDLREFQYYAKRHIPGAISMPYEYFNENHPVFRQYGIIILCCERGATSLNIGRKLSEKNYKVFSLAGGMESWRGPTISG